MFAIDAISDAVVKKAFEELAPNAEAGSQEAADAWDKVEGELDFDSSDGTPADEYAGKSLDPNHGGRTQLLNDKIQVVHGKTPEEAAENGKAHFFNVVKAATPEMEGAGLGARIRAWQDAHPVVV